MKEEKGNQNPAQVMSDLTPDELQVGNILSYTHKGVKKNYKVLWVSPLVIFLDPIEPASKSNPQIKCNVYQAEPVSITSDIWGQLPISMNDVPATITNVHELQNWYYWNNGKRRLELTIKP